MHTCAHARAYILDKARNSTQARMEKDFGLECRRVNVNKGDVILWRYVFHSSTLFPYFECMSQQMVCGSGSKGAVVCECGELIAYWYPRTHPSLRIGTHAHTPHGVLVPTRAHTHLNANLVRAQSHTSVITTSERTSCIVALRPWERHPTFERSVIHTPRQNHTITTVTAFVRNEN